MTRNKLLLAAGIAISVIVVGFAVFVVITLVFRYAAPHVESDELPDHALTPMEAVTEAVPHKDGTMTVRKRLVFETPPEGDDEVGLWFGPVGLGQEPGSDKRMRMMPEASEVTGVELSTEDGSTRQAPKTEGDLHIDVETEREEGFDYPSAHFSFRPVGADGQPTRWAEGRHVVELRYVLDKVFLTVAGEQIVVLPLPSIGVGRATQITHTLLIDTEGPLHCPDANLDFELPENCTDNDFAQVDYGADSGARLTWRRSYTHSINVIAFAPPEGMTVSPIRPYERG